MWRAEWGTAEKAVCGHASALKNDPRVPLDILRVDQLDAAELDNAIVSLLKEPFTRAAALFGVRCPVPAWRQSPFGNAP